MPLVEYFAQFVSSFTLSKLIDEQGPFRIRSRAHLDKESQLDLLMFIDIRSCQLLCFLDKGEEYCLFVDVCK